MGGDPGERRCAKARQRGRGRGATRRAGVTAALRQEHKPEGGKWFLTPWHPQGPYVEMVCGECQQIPCHFGKREFCEHVPGWGGQVDTWRRLGVHAHRDHKTVPTFDPRGERRPRGQLTCSGITPGTEQDSHLCWPDAKAQRLLNVSPSPATLRNPCFTPSLPCLQRLSTLLTTNHSIPWPGEAGARGPAMPTLPAWLGHVDPEDNLAWSL